jgi:hypothetical protein
VQGITRTMKNNTSSSATNGIPADLSSELPTAKALENLTEPDVPLQPPLSLLRLSRASR